MKRLILALLVGLALTSCEENAGKCWECEIKYLNIKTSKLITVDDTLKVCGQTRDEVALLETNAEIQHPVYGKVRKLEYCEEAKR